MTSPDAAIKDKQCHMLPEMPGEIIKWDFFGLSWEVDPNPATV